MAGRQLILVHPRTRGILEPGFQRIAMRGPSIERPYVSADQTETLARHVDVATQLAEAFERGQFIPSPGRSCSTYAFEGVPEPGTVADFGIGNPRGTARRTPPAICSTPEP